MFANVLPIDKCFMAEHVFESIMTPIFVAEGMYDSWQVNNILELGCGNPTPEQSCDNNQLAAFFAYGADMNAALTAALASSETAGASAGVCSGPPSWHGETLGAGPGRRGRAA